MKRYHQEIARTQREYQLHQREMHRAIETSETGENGFCYCRKQAGRFRKHRAIACERRFCSCKDEKLYRVPTIKQRRLDSRSLSAINDFLLELAEQ